MSERQHEDPSAMSSEPLAEAVGRRAARKIKARGERHRGVWFGLGMFGLIGWSVAVPTVIGIACGIWLDSRLDQPISWTLTCLFFGVALGCANAWYWVRREGHVDRDG